MYFLSLIPRLFLAFITCYTARVELVSFPGSHVWVAKKPGNEAGEELASFPGYHTWAAQEPGNEAEGQSNKASRRQCAQDSDLVMDGCNERVTCLHAR